jgi:hypothetical protein
LNPIVHAELSWLTAQGLPRRRDRIIVTLAGVAPDLDGLSLVGGVETYGRWHHVLTHGAPAALACGVIALAVSRRFAVAGLAVLAFHLHLLCDLMGSGPGWPIFYAWPFSRAELMWSGQWNLASWQNSVIGMTATTLCLACALWTSRTPVELFSLKQDAKVVAALRARFRRS